MIDTLSIHINTTQTQLEIKSEILKLAEERLTSILNNFQDQLQIVEFHSDD